MACSLLGFFWADKYPTVPPDFATHVGWLCFAFVALILVWSWARAESVRRALLALEDPRTFAVLRIGFALMTIGCFLNLYPYWRMLWSDEGIFDLAYAQDRLGRTALRGWDPDEGFFDLWAYLNFLWNKPSWFYTQGSPDFVFGYMMVFFTVLLMYAVGLWSRVTGVIAWLMMSGIYNRNALYWEGTDTVYRAFWFILLFAKTGHAWSIDNWWRCRRLRKKGRLAEPSDADTADDGQTRGSPATAGKEPIYRLVPAWPRYLFMLQLAAIYVTTGSVKTGSVWARGDALYYALNMDHFYRFEGITQWVSSVFGMNLFRVNTWVTHWWEMLFPVVLIGMVLRFGLQHKDKPWYQAQNVAWRKWLGRAALVGAYALLYRIVYVSVPFCLAMHDDKVQDSTLALQKIHVVFGVIIPVAVLAWFAVGRWPVVLFRGGRSVGPLTRRVSWLKIPEIRIDQASLRALFLGRRAWLTVGFIFHGFLILFMNIGMFPFIMLMTYAGFVEGDEIVRGTRRIAELLRRRRWGARLAPPSLDRLLVSAERPQDVKVRGRRVPDGIVLVFGLIGASLIWGKVERVEWIGEATYWWLGSILAVSTAFRLLRPRPAELTRARQSGPALAYGATGRALALGAVVWHASAVALHLFPSYPIFNKWKSPARSIFSTWLRGTGTSQSWRMFAPNPPRANTFMKTVVVLEDGRRFDLRNNSFHYDEESGPPSRPNPWIINDRMRKMQRRMVGKGKWYLRYWAQYQCREWALEHGEMPQKIVISKLVTHIPPPEVISFWVPEKFRGHKHSSGAVSGQPYDPRKLKVSERDVQTHSCRNGGELPLFMKERYGLPITEEDREKARKDEQRLERKYVNRKQVWERRRDWGKWFDDDDEDQRRRPRTRPSRGSADDEDETRQGGADGDGEDEQ